MTCKKKRLKCDETKPSCVQCQKRSVVCEGYKKDYKWRSFEETTFNPKPAAKKKTVRSNSFAADNISSASQPRDIANVKNVGAGAGAGAGSAPTSNPQQPNNDTSPSNCHPPNSWSPGLHSAFADAAQAFQDPGHASASSTSPDHKANFKGPGPGPGPRRFSPPLDLPPDQDFMPTFDTNDNSPTLSLDDTVNPFHLFSNAAAPGDNSARSFGSGSGSPQLLDLLLPGTDMNQPPDPSEIRPPLSPLPYQPSAYEIGMGDLELGQDFDEEIMRTEAFPDHSTMMPSVGPPVDPNNPSWNLRSASPTPSDASTASSRSSGLTMLAQPTLDASSPEMLMLRFDRNTCGILSVKDGPTENPWRTLIWPLARESQALYHAISSMTAFHGAVDIPNLQLLGMAHMTKSIKRLAVEIQNMRLDTALATSLALAFSEGWDSHVSTGVQHLRGAKIMVNNAVVKHRRDMQTGQMTTQDASRLKFLCNTFVYMDVIARLTSLEESVELNFEEILSTVNAPLGEQQAEVDPLMGCATTLFPLIGRVANLIQRVRKVETNSLNIVSQAMELKEQLQRWQVPSAVLFERPEDPSSEVQHSIQTADAYRYAMLLYLHQAVPEIPSDPPSTLAKKVLVTLASVPLSSRTTIVQIFPLFAASCEITNPEDRNWVMTRWDAMMSRLKIGNVTSGWNVVQEVWSRRDAFENEKANRLLRRYNSRGVPGGNFVPPVIRNSNGPKRKGQSVRFGDMGDSSPDDNSQIEGHAFADEVHGGAGARPSKARRLTFNSPSSGRSMDDMDIFGNGDVGGSMPMSMPSLTRRHTGDILNDQLEPEYTVRGKLHWLGVMTDWHWEGMSNFCFLLIVSSRFTLVAGVFQFPFRYIQDRYGLPHWPRVTWHSCGAMDFVFFLPRKEFVANDSFTVSVFLG